MNLQEDIQIKLIFRLAPVLLSLLFVLVPVASYGAQISVMGPPVEQGQGIYSIPVVIDTGNDSINAVSGEVILPEGLNVGAILVNQSVVSFWVREPKIEPADQKGSARSIGFSGVIAGGVSTRAGNLFNIVFTSVDANNKNYTIQLKNLVAFKNDGLGTSITLKPVQTSFAVRSVAAATSTIVFNAQLAGDVTPPDPFEPALGHNTHVFDDKWFVAFATRDSGSGIDHYEVQETSNRTPDPNKWVRASSPYVLQNQNGRVTIFIKAIDKAGNSATALITHAGDASLRGYWWIFAALTLVGLMALLVLVKRWSRHPVIKPNV